MKPFAIILIVLCIAALIGVGFLYMTSNVTVTGTGCTASDALDMGDAFSTLKQELETESFTGTLYQLQPQLGEPSAYQFYTYKIRLQNASFLPAETVEIQVTPMDGDILQIGDQVRHDLKARSTGEFTATILTTKEMHNVRELKITWYIWGMPFSTKVTYSH